MHEALPKKFKPELCLLWQLKDKNENLLEKSSSLDHGGLEL